MSRRISKTRNMVVTVLVTAILILSIFGYVSDAINYLKEKFSPGGANYSGACVEMIDVGQGDSILLLSGGKAALIDTGLKTYAKNVSRALENKGVKTLDLLLISHNHSDHMGGIVPITEEFGVKNLVIPDLNKTDERTDKMQTAISNVKKGGGKCITAKKGTNLKVGEFDITVLGCYYDEKDENDRSIVVKAKIGKWKFLFTGDAQGPAERRLLDDGVNVKCDVLKVGHHGSMYGTTEEFLEAAAPSLSMISCGKGNRYSHPHDVVLLRLKEAGSRVWRTDTSGSVTFNITEKEITVETEK